MKQILLSDGQYATVDDCDYVACMEYRWTTTTRSKQYAMTYIPGSGKGGKPRTCVYLHRFIAGRMGLELPQGVEVDHKDRNPLNNRRGNLRAASSAQQKANRGVTVRNKLGVKGVFRCKRNGKYRAEIVVNKRNLFLGRFDTIEEAKAAYFAAAQKHYGEFARA